MNRNALLDVSRAIAVMLVLTYHIWRDTGRPSFPIGDGFDIYGFMGNGWVGVGIFFVISGYCMGMSTRREFSNGLSARGYLRYIAKRFLRIAPPYYVAVLLWVFIIDKYGIAVKGTSLFDIITHLTFTHNFFPSTLFSISGVFWTIAVEMQFYFLLPILLVLIKRPLHAWVLFLLSLIVSVIVLYSNLSPLYNWSLLVYLPLFLFGYILNKNKEELTNAINTYKLTYILLPLFIILLSYKGNGYDNNIRIYEIMISITFGMLMIKMISMSWSFGLVKVLSFIGSASFSIYLYNYSYMSVIPSTGYNPMSSLMMWLSVVAVGVLMYLLVETQTERVRKIIFAKKSSIKNNTENRQDT